MEGSIVTHNQKQLCLLEQRMIILSKSFPVAKSFLRNFTAVSVPFRNPAKNL